MPRVTEEFIEQLKANCLAKHKELEEASREFTAASDERSLQMIGDWRVDFEETLRRTLKIYRLFAFGGPLGPIAGTDVMMRAGAAQNELSRFIEELASALPKLRSLVP